MSSAELIELGVLLLIGVLGMPVMDFIKKKLGLEGMPAMFLVAGLSTAMGLVALFVAGEVGLVDFSLANLPEVAALVFTAASFAYRLVNPEPQS